MANWSPDRQQAVQARLQRSIDAWVLNRDECDLLDALAALAAKDAEIAKLTGQLAECYRLTGADPDGCDDAMLAKHAVSEVKRLFDESEEESSRQQADLTRLAEVEEKARRVFEFGCSCGAVFDSLEAHAEHVALVHTGPDAKE